MGKRQFGSIRKLPSGRFQARYIGPDGKLYTGRTGDGRALTFGSKTDAGTYLDGISTDIGRGKWVSPNAPKAAAPVTFEAYARTWLAGRDLSESTRLLYGNVLAHILPAFGDVALPSITPAAVRRRACRCARRPRRRTR